MELPFSQACENNKRPILEQISPFLKNRKSVFEIGSGTGQHAVFFAQQMPQLTWQATDQRENVPNIQKRIELSGLTNLPNVLTFDVTEDYWPENLDCVYSANTAHIMPWPVTQRMLKKVAQSLAPDGYFFLYGPFNYEGQYTSDSNRDFDQWLKLQNPEMGIRDFEKLNNIAADNGLLLTRDCQMPANNRLLIWHKGEV